MKANSTLESVISFRLPRNEKNELEKLINVSSSNKSDFLRKTVKQILTTTKK